MTSPLQIIKSLNLGQLLLIETQRELLVGTLRYVDPKNFMIELENVRDMKTDFTYQSPQMLAYQQMKSIKLIKENNAEKLTDITSSTDSDSDEIIKDLKSLTTSVSNSKEQPLKQQLSIESNSKQETEDLNVQLSALDLQLLRQQLDSVVYITQTDQKYHKALADIKSQTIIGLLIDPAETARHRKTSLIAVATTKTIYIFDILNLGKIFKEFRLLLESERPRKAVHYSHRVVDHLKHRHDLELAGVFDTFVAYCVVSGEKNNKTLGETIQSVFNISDIYFEPEFAENRSPNPYMRPLSPDVRMVIAKKVAFQLKLCDYLLHEQMLKNFISNVIIFPKPFCTMKMVSWWPNNCIPKVVWATNTSNHMVIGKIN